MYQTESAVMFTHGAAGKLIVLLCVVYAAAKNLYLGSALMFVAIVYYKSTDAYLSAIKANYLDGVDAIYWINLDRSTERRQRMESMFADPVFSQIPIERIRATDGKDAESSFMRRLQFVQKRNTRLEYACLISHLDAIRRFAESPYETAIIMEDDATLELRPYWKKSVREIMASAPADWDILQLCYNTSANLTQDFTLNTNYGEPRQYGNCACLAAYLVRKSAAKRLIDEVYDKKGDVYTLKDYHTHEADHYLFKCMKTYIYRYMMFVYPTENDSTLHPEDLPSHVQSKNRVLQMYKAVLSNP
jgi:GR25 family glycosyltransferase involved in LPS biosynthesis